jgi:predicted metal-dependent hydrolase
LSEEEPPPALFQAIEQFNRREFFECHETLEKIWLEEPGEVRHLYQGILQVGVGFYHAIKRKNYWGATSLLQKGIDCLRPFTPMYFGIDLVGLIATTTRALEQILAIGPEDIEKFDTGYIPQICFIENVKLGEE